MSARRGSGVSSGRAAGQPASRSRAAASSPTTAGAFVISPRQHHRDRLVERHPADVSSASSSLALVALGSAGTVGQPAGQEDPDHLVGAARRRVHVDQQVQRPATRSASSASSRAAAVERSSPATSISPAGSSHR